MPGFNAIGADAIGASSTAAQISGVSVDLAASYAVRSAVSGDLAVQYAVRAQVFADLGAAYAVNSLVNADLTAGYSVRSQVSADLPVAYSVEALAMSSVSATLAVAYSVCASVSSDLAVAFAVEPPIDYVRAPIGSVHRCGLPAYPDAVRRIGPAQAAVSLEAARRAARVDGDELDDEIMTAAVAYTEAAEHMTGRAFVQQTLRATFRAFSAEMILPKPPMISVVHVAFYDEAGVLRYLDPRDYFVDIDAEPAVLTPAPGRAWPVTIHRAAAVEVKYFAGYGPTEASMPRPVKQYVLARIQQQFSPVATAKDANFDRLLDSYWTYA